MTDSGSTQLPVGARATIKAAQARAAETRTVEITKIPDDLLNTRTPTKLRGEVVRRNDDGSVRVRTERGDVDILPPQDQPTPRDGQRIELKIKPGNPPQEATIQSANTQTTEGKTAPSEAQTIDAGNQQRPITTPINVELGQNIATSAESLTLAALPQSETTVRLQVLSPQEAATITTAFAPQTLTATLIAPLTFEAEKIALQSQASLEGIQPLTVQTTAPEALQTLSQSQAAQTSELSSFTPQVITTTVPATTRLTLSAPTPPRAALEIFSINGPSVLSAATSASLPPQTSFTAPILPPLSASSVTITHAPLAQALLKSAKAEPSIYVKIQSVALPKLELTSPLAATDAESKAQAAPKDSPPISITENIRAGNIRAVVSGLTAENLPVLSLSLPGDISAQSFALHIPAPDITPGTQVQITPQAALAASVNAAAILAPPLTVFITPGQWPLMQDIQHAVAQISTASAQVISNITPSPANPAQFTPAALFFLSAVRSGDIGGWLGEKTMEILRYNGRSNLLSRMISEVNMMSRLATEPLSQDWRALPLPMMWENEMQKVMLFYRREEGENEAEQNGEKQTRFIFELSLSQMGPVQIDGLFRNKRLDVILRTEERFSEHMHMAMRQTYAEALRQTDITGELSFQNSPEQWVKINAENKSQENLMA